MKLNKIVAATLVSAVALSALAACGGSNDDKRRTGSKTVTLWFAGKADTPPRSRPDSQGVRRQAPRQDAQDRAH